MVKKITHLKFYGMLNSWKKVQQTNSFDPDILPPTEVAAFYHVFRVLLHVVQWKSYDLSIWIQSSRIEECISVSLCQLKQHLITLPTVYQNIFIAIVRRSRKTHLVLWVVPVEKMNCNAFQHALIVEDNTVKVKVLLYIWRM